MSNELPKVITVQRLEALRQGETMVYYRGADLDADIARDLPSYCAPKHGEVLRQVRYAAEQLARNGAVRLSARPATINGAPVIEFVATGA